MYSLFFAVVQFYAVLLYLGQRKQIIPVVFVVQHYAKNPSLLLQAFNAFRIKEKLKKKSFVLKFIIFFLVNVLCYFFGI